MKTKSSNKKFKIERDIEEKEWLQIQDDLCLGQSTFLCILESAQITETGWQSICNSILPLLKPFAVEYKQDVQTDIQDEACDVLYLILMSITKSRPSVESEIDPVLLACLYNECEKFLISSRLVFEDRNCILRPPAYRSRLSKNQEMARASLAVDKIVSAQNLLRELTIEFGFSPMLSLSVFEELMTLASKYENLAVEAAIVEEVAYSGKSEVRIELSSNFGTEDIFFYNIVRLLTIGLGWTKKETISSLTEWMRIRKHHSSSYQTVTKRMERLEDLDKGIKKRFAATYLSVFSELKKDSKTQSSQRLEIHLTTSRKKSK